MSRALEIAAFGLVLVASVCPKGEKVCKSDLKVGDEHDYTYDATFDVKTVDLEALTDATICWDGATSDIRGRAMDPTDLTEITITNLTLTGPEIAAKVVDNSLDQSYVADYRAVDLSGTDDTCVLLSDFTIIGNDFMPDTEFLENPDTSWLATLWKENAYGRNEILMSTIIRPVTGSDNHEASITATSSELSFDPDLEVGTRVPISTSDKQYVVDWNAVTVDVNGREFDERQADTLIIGKVDTQNLGEVEDGFLQLYETADELYTMEVYGLRSATLIDDGSIELMDDEGSPLVPRDLDGNAFEGFTTSGTWLIGLECSTCTSPAPMFLAVADVCSDND